MIRFTATTAKASQHAIGDAQAPKRFKVTIDGTVVGEVFTTSRESRTGGSNRHLGSLRGYSRSWQAVAATGETVAWAARSRAAAADELLAARR